jgi:type III secretion protein T
MNEYWTLIVALGLTLPRIMAAFFMLPAFSSNVLIPGLVRNTFVVSIAMIALPFLLIDGVPIHLTSTQLVALIFKETLIGILIGFFFSGIFWVIGSAGNIIDTKVGANTADIVDPFLGYEEQLAGAFLSRLAIWIFAASGGFIIFLGILFQSYALWPVTLMLPSLPSTGLLIVIGHFGQMIALTIIFAAPALFIFSLVELGFALINRISPKLDIQITGTSIKVFLTVGLLWLSLSEIVKFATNHLIGANALLKSLLIILPQRS